MSMCGACCRNMEMFNVQVCSAMCRVYYDHKEYRKKMCTGQLRAPNIFLVNHGLYQPYSPYKLIVSRKAYVQC